MTKTKCFELVNKVVRAVSKFIVGYERNIELMIITMLSRGHALLLGYPGSAKTLTAKLVAEALGLDFRRIQMTSDLLPTDIVGTKIVDPKTGDLRTVKGPIFANIVLVDEINRGNPKTQAALLEAMQEYQVTIEGETYRLPQPFMVIATLNPIETQGIFPLPQAQLDRFSISLDFRYPNTDEEVEILTRDHKNKGLEPRLKPICSIDEVMKAIDEASSTYVDNVIIRYIVNIVNKLRKLEEIVLGPSPRASVTILRIAKAMAAVRGRDYVIPDDIKYVVPYVLRHRMQLKQSLGMNLWEQVLEIQEKIMEILESEATPW